MRMTESSARRGILFLGVIGLLAGRPAVPLAQVVTGDGTVTEGPTEQLHKGPAVELARGDLRVSKNGRFLIHADGSPFWWQGDTAWELFHRLDREEVAHYLDRRREQGFTVVLAVALSELDGLGTPNAYGHRPLTNNDPARPAVVAGAQNDYWDHVDHVLDAAAARGMYIALLPTWADKVGLASSTQGPVVFNATNARSYGRFLGQRYKNRRNLVWVLGGDRPVVALPRNGGTDFAPIWRAMAAGIREQDRRHLMTFHPWRPDSSSRWFHDEPWLDFNMLQSGHGAKDYPNWARIAGDYALSPAKPCIDAEPRYEDHAVSHRPELGWFDAYDVRQAAYWAVFAGAFGHTYGSHAVWQMYDEKRKPAGQKPRSTWRQALDNPGAADLLHLRRLMLSRPFLTRVPDPSVVVAGRGDDGEHVEATRDRAGSYAFVYIPTGKPVRVDLRKVTANKVKAWWFDPRTGAHRSAGDFEPQGRGDFLQTFVPPGDYPGRGQDWVLVLDDAARNFPPPGRP